MNNEEEFDVIGSIKICLKKRKILLIIMLIALVLGIIYTFLLKTALYKSSEKILIDKADASISQFVTSNDITQEVATGLNVDSSYISQNVTVTFSKDTKILSIEASSTNNTESYNMVIKYEEILKTKLEAVYSINSFNIIEQAQVPDAPYNIQHAKDLLIFLAVGALICIVYCIYLITFSGFNIYYSIENNKMTLLGAISKEEKAKSKVKAYITKEEKIISQMNKIMTNIELNKRFPRPKSLLVTATEYKVGTTYVVANLAMRYQKSGKRVLIIDSNFDNGIEHKIFNLDTRRGLSDLILLNNITTEDIFKAIKTSPVNNIFVLPCGRVKVDEGLLISERLVKIIEKMKDQFDIIIVDGEPILKQITAYGWANIANASVIVTEYSKTKIEEIIKVKKTIEEVGGRVSGVIVNKAEQQEV